MHTLISLHARTLPGNFYSILNSISLVLAYTIKYHNQAICSGLIIVLEWLRTIFFSPQGFMCHGFTRSEVSFLQSEPLVRFLMPSMLQPARCTSLMRLPNPATKLRKLVNKLRFSSPLAYT